MELSRLFSIYYKLSFKKYSDIKFLNKIQQKKNNDVLVS